MTDDKQPHRVVTQDGHAWMLTVGGYSAGYGTPTRTLDELREAHPLLRPVEPITDEDEALLRETFQRAGRKTITTLAAALEQVFHELRESAGGLAAVHDSYDYAKRTLIAGRPGSWESAVLIEVMLFGNGLNLARKGNATVEAMRKAGPSKRVDVECRQVLADMLTRWVTGPDRFVEVAETLAWQVSSYADATAGRNGWAAVADQWLQPTGLAAADFRTCYRLFYSLSKHLRTEML